MAKLVISVTFPRPCRTPKPDMVNISLFAQIFLSLCLRKRINFTSTLDYMNHLKFNTLKSHKKHAHTEHIFLILKFQ